MTSAASASSAHALPQPAVAPAPGRTPVDGNGQATSNLKKRTGKAFAQTKKDLGFARLKPMLRPTRQLLAGAATIGASSFALAQAVAKPLARMSAENPQSTQLFTKVPWLGGFINELIGKGGALGALGIAAPLLGLVLTCVQSQGRTSDRMHWLLTHCAMGLSASPMWLLPLASAAGLLPALALSAACMLGVSVVLNERINNKQATVQMLFVGVMLVFGGAPIPALLVTGAAASVAVTAAAVTLAGGAAVLAGVTLFNNFAALSDDSTAELRACATTSDLSSWRLNLPDEASPTVVTSAQPLIDHVSYLQNQLRAGKRLHVRTMMLSGPPGTGKTAISRSMGNALNAKTYLISPSKIMASENPAQAIRNLFAQAKILGGRAIFFFDDAEVLFGDRQSERKLDGGFDALTLMTTTLNDCLDGIERDAYEMLLVVLSTNNKNYLDDSIKQRFARCDVEILPPDRVFFGEQFKTCFNRAFAAQFGAGATTLRPNMASHPGSWGFAHAKPKPVELPAAVLGYAMDAYDRAAGDEDVPVMMVGREMMVMCDIMLEDLNVRQGVPLHGHPTEAQLLLALQRSFEQVVQQARRNVRSQSAAKPAKADASAKA